MVAWNNDVADTILDEVKEVCDGLGLEFYLIAGTCLGFYRDGCHIPWTTDIDIGVVASAEQYTELKNELITQGYSCADLGSRGFGHARKEGVLLDVHRLNAGSPYPAMDPRFFVSFGIITYKEREYKIPYPVEEYLEYCYGENWRAPDPSWQG